MLQRSIKCATLLFQSSEHHYYKICRNIWNQSVVCGSVMVHQTSLNFNEFNNNLKRSVPLTPNEFRNLKSLKPLQPENPHLLKVSILGEPNVGKSTLTNRLVKWRVCSVSSKVHTTRRKARAVLVENNVQIVFLDTPGFVTPEKSKRHSLEASFVMDPVISIREADLIAVVVDTSNHWTRNRINNEILRILYEFKEKKSILILNKIDTFKSKKRLLTLARILTGIEEERKEIDDTEISVEDVLNEVSHQPVEDIDSDFYENIEQKVGWPLFSKVFMVSALKNDGIEHLRNYLLNEAVPKDWMYHEGVVTDQHPHDIALMTVRENLLEYLPNEIPYKLNLKITRWEILSTGCPKINIEIVCPSSRHRRFVIGPDGKHIAACVEKSKRAMKESFRKDVVLKVAVK